MSHGFRQSVCFAVWIWGGKWNLWQKGIGAKMAAEPLSGGHNHYGKSLADVSAAVMFPVKEQRLRDSTN